MTPVQTIEQVLDIFAANRPEFRRFGVVRLGLFGSFARNEQTETSDVDIIVEFGPGLKNFRNFMALADYLESLFGREVEIVTPESLSPYLKLEILRDARYVKVA